MRWLVVVLVLAIAVSPLASRAAGPTFADAARTATLTLLSTLYAEPGAWRECNAADCPRSDSDWGVDAQTFALYLRWSATRDPRIAGILAALSGGVPRYGTPCAEARRCATWSDTPSWDAIVLARAYEVTGDPRPLAAAEAAARFVERSAAFVGGACPAILYQMPHTGEHAVKTLETEANLVKAEVLLFRDTHDPAYLRAAVQRYTAAREAYKDRRLPLYTVHVIDDGAHCVQTEHRFFASVNGDMIWNGFALTGLTGEPRYAAEALATARAVDRLLSDDRRIFVDAGGENDVVEPLVEGMMAAARRPEGDFARRWILRNAAAAIAARAADGTFARFFDGPSQGRTSAWQGNGGLALEIAAGTLAPADQPAADDGWASAVALPTPVTTLPSTLVFAGSGIALVGTISRECETEHVQVLIDGEPLVDRTGLWRNHGMPGGAQPAVVFAWRWPTAGTHTIRLVGGPVGGAALKLTAYVAP